jgi:hypothetical protein
MAMTGGKTGPDRSGSSRMGEMHDVEVSMNVVGVKSASELNQSLE